MLAISTEPGVLSPALVVQRPLMNLRRSTLRTNTPHFDGGPGGPLIAWYIHTVRPQVPTVATARNGITKAVTMRNAYISIRRLCDALSIFCGALDMMSRSRPLDLGQMLRVLASASETPIPAIYSIRQSRAVFDPDQTAVLVPNFGE